MSVDVSTRNTYMQNNTLVTDKFILWGIVELDLEKHRISYRNKIYTLAESAQHIEGVTTVMVNGS